MRVAALYDIHGNLPALEAVLAEVKAFAPDRILIGGDVALGPMPRETLDCLMSLGDRVMFIRGNCDREMATAIMRPAGVDTRPTAAASAWAARSRWAALRCSLAQLQLLSGMPITMRLEITGLGATLFCHGSPRRDDEILTRISPERRLRAALTGNEHGLVVSGHTHVQYDRLALGKRWVNPGSVGMAYADTPGAYWATFGPDVQLRRTAYDVERTIAAVRENGFPEPEEFVEKYLLRCPDPAEATAFFERMAEGVPAA